MPVNALVVGGTGPTGPLIVQGLVDRGFEVTVYHRGQHEVDGMPPVRHLHGDPFERERIGQDLKAGQWDVVCSMYGRLRYIADALANRCGRFIGIGSAAGNIAADLLPYPKGRAIPIGEDHPRYRERVEGKEIGWAVAETERRVMEHHGNGAFEATVFRYTSLYGPRVPRQWLWPIVRRALDRRPFIILPGGLDLFPACFTENAAAHVLAAVDSPAASGEVFNSVDQATYFLRDVVQIVAREVGHQWDVIELFHPLAERLASGYVRGGMSGMALLDGSKLTRVLGYENDSVPAEEGIARTARWLADHAGELDGQLGDIVKNPYAYDLEDRFIASYREWSREVQAQIDLAQSAPLAGSRPY